MLGHAALRRRRPDLFRRRRAHYHVNILENLATLDSAAAVRRFNQIIARLTALFQSECIDEHERFGELLRFDQKARAINVPYSRRIPHLRSPLGEGESFLILISDWAQFLRTCFLLAGVVFEREPNLLAGLREVNPTLLVQ